MRKIIHVDLDAFFCAVEELRDPSLRGKPFAVGGKPDERGVVASCSYPARRLGVRSAMPMSRAVRLCPQLIIVPARHRAYSEVSEQVMQRLRNLTPLVEQISIDEAFLDVSDLPEPAELIARRLQKQIRDELNLSCSLGVASNKLVAKIATDVGKASARSNDSPNAIQIVEEKREAHFLSPLPAIALWGVGPKTAAQLESKGMRTIGDIARQPEGDLVRWFGKHGYDLARHSKGIDDRPIVTSYEPKSISQETTFVRDVRDAAILKRTLRAQADEVAKSLRREKIGGVTVKLKIRWSDFTTLTRQKTLTQPTDQANIIYELVEQLFNTVWKNQAVRLIGVGVSGLGEMYKQLSLLDNNERERKLQEMLDNLDAKFGKDVVKRGSEMKNETMNNEQ